jgi:hypothetical protein
MPPKIKLEVNAPRELSFLYPKGKAVESRYGYGVQYYRLCVGGTGALYADEPLERKLLDMRVQVNEPVRITKRKTATGAVFYDVQRVNGPAPVVQNGHAPTKRPILRKPAGFPTQAYETSQRDCVVYQPPATGNGHSAPSPSWDDIPEAGDGTGGNHHEATPETVADFMARQMNQCLRAACQAVDGLPVKMSAAEIQALACTLYINANGGRR